MAVTATLAGQAVHQPVLTVDLPGFPLAVAEADGWVAVSLGLEGVAFVASQPWGDGEPRVTLREDWPALLVLDLPGPGFLIAGRDGAIRFVVSDPPGSDPIQISHFPVEGIPNEIALEGNTLILATGGAGVSLWDWPDKTAAPVLRGRYPFLEFARRIAVDPGGERVYVADSIGGRVAVLDIRDPMRPRLEESYPVSSFCDSVAVDARHLVFTDRNVGAFVARRVAESAAAGGGPWVLHQQIPLVEPHRERRDGKRGVLLPGGNDLLLCEAESGARHWRLDEADGRFREVARYRPEGAAMDAAPLASGYLAVVDHPRGVSFFLMEEIRN